MQIRKGSPVIIVFILVASLLSACTSSVDPQDAAPEDDGLAGEEVSPTSTPLPPTSTPIPTETPEPTQTPLPTSTSPPPTPIISAAGAELVCRFGPGDEYVISGSFLLDDTAPVLGKNEEQSWVVIEHPRMPGRFCWLRVEEAQIDGDVGMVPISPPPENIVLGVSARLEPAVLKLSSCTFPASFEAFFTIEVSGPTTVTYRLVSNEGTSSWRTKSFSNGGPKYFEEKFEVDSAGSYFYRVEVNSPNVIQGETSGVVECP